jgi:NTP pyrophosphatase (non-canonical NTP hydrolase)
LHLYCSTKIRFFAEKKKQWTKSFRAFERLLTIMDDLREKCPWDRKQTFQTLRILTIEETYELADAILEEDVEGIKEEIGDLMLHMVFYAKIADEQKALGHCRGPE